MQRPSANINAKVRIVFARTFLLFLLIAIHVKCADKNEAGETIDKISDSNKKEKTRSILAPSIPEFKVGDSLFENYQYQKALNAYKSVTNKLRKRKNYKAYIEGLLDIGMCHFYLANYNEGIKELQKAIRINKNHNYPYHGISTAHLFLGQCFSLLDEPDSALESLQKSMSIIEGINDVRDKKKILIYNAIGFVYQKNFMDYLHAEEYFLKSLKILERQKVPDKDVLYCYYFLGKNNRAKGDYQKALSYSLKALRIAKSLKSSIWEENCYSLIAVIYYYKKDYTNSLIYHKRTLGLTEKSVGKVNFPQNMINIGSVYYSIGNYSQAILYYKKAFTLSHKFNNLYVYADSHLSLGEVYAMTGKSDSAFYYLNTCLQIKQKLYGNCNREVAIAFLYLGKLYQSLNNHDSALVKFQNAFLNGIPKFQNKDIFSNPTKDQLIRHTDFLITLSRKAYSQKEVYKERGYDKYLLASMQSYLLVDQVLDLQRKLYDDDYSKMNFNAQSKELYDEAVECSFMLYERFKSHEYLKHAFYFMEKSKANILLENLQGAEAFSKVGIPYSIRKRESLLKSKFAFYQSKLFQLSLDSTTENRLELYHDKILNISKDLELLKGEVALKYPRYYQIKYAPQQLSLLKVIEYSKENNAIIIEYHYGIKEIYALSISPEEVGFVKITNVDSVNNSLNSLLSLIKNAESNLMSERNYLNYQQCAFSIYKKLLDPCILNKYKAKRNIIIIPDEKLSLIPFEALLNEPSAKKTINYRDLPYLIKKYNIQYGYSTNIYFSKRTKEKNEINLIAFDYASGKNSVGDEALEINGTKKELLSIQKVLGGQFFFGLKATEQNFKKYAPSATIIHLAIHGVADTLNPLNSKLLFMKDSKDNQNGVLYSYELYNMRLNASLIVLSACETGKGRNFKGEGIMSIGRAFRYSGGSSLILSLWSINDQTTAKIMGNFYNSISDGNTLSESLKSAKSKYLMDGDEITSHPIYWAGILAYGNVEDIIIYRKNFKLLWILTSTSLLITLVLIIYFKRKNTRRIFPLAR